MGLYQKIDSDSKAALRAGDKMKLSVLRMVLSSAKMIEIEKGQDALDDASVAQIIQKQIKQHKESIDQFNSGNRPDLVKKETEELNVLESYIPKQLTDEEVASLVKEAIAQTGAVSKSDMGKVMKAVLEKAQGRSDGKTVNRIVMSLLK